MDISSEFILMCEKAIEIQEGWVSSIGDFYFDKRSLDEGSRKKYIAIKIVPYTLWEDSINHYKTRNNIWLPRQDQLQEMVEQDLDEEITKVQLLRNFFFFCSPYWSLGTMPHKRDIKEAEKQKEYIDRFRSMEQLWLAFVMKEKFSKRWDGKDWF